MKKVASLLCFSVLGLSVSALAGGESCVKNASAGAGAATCTAGKDKGCAVGEACCDSMPKLVYKIGDKTSCCPDEAGKLANGDKTKIRYVVASEEFDNEGDAQKTLATALGKFYDAMLTVKSSEGATLCCASGKSKTGASEGDKKPATFTLASYTFTCKESAEKTAAEARQAAEKITMKMMVGDKEYTCPVSAKAACTNGEKIEYVVGESKTPCDTMASVQLAKARIEAARKVIAAAAEKSMAAKS